MVNGKCSAHRALQIPIPGFFLTDYGLFRLIVVFEAELVFQVKKIKITVVIFELRLSNWVPLTEAKFLVSSF